jgi:hypothetical protein
MIRERQTFLTKTGCLPGELLLDQAVMLRHRLPPLLLLAWLESHLVNGLYYLRNLPSWPRLRTHEVG